MKHEIVKIESPELEILEKSRADQIRTTFEPMVKMLEEFESQYVDIISESEKEITKELTLKAKRVRLDIGKVRIETGKLKDKQKEYIKLEDKAIMGVHNILVWAVKEKEDKLKGIEDFFEIQEQKKLQALQSERAEKLSNYVDDAHERNLSGMDEDVWKAYFESKKKEYEDRIAAEKKAEEDRIAKEKTEAEEREKIKIENERLKKEAEAKEKQIAAEKAKAEAERKAIEAKAQKERDEAARILKAEQESARIAAEKASAEKAKLEDELKAKAEAERKAKEEEAARLQSELNKGDADKVKDLINDLKNLKIKYVFKSEKNQKMYQNFSLLIDGVINFIN